MLTPVYKNQFNKNLKRMMKCGKSSDTLKTIMTQLVEDKPLAQRYHDHP